MIERNRRALLVPALLGLAMLVAAVWVMWAGRGLGIHGDEVFYIGHLTLRNGAVEQLHGIEYWIAPHNSHMVILGRLIFSALYNVFGTTYWVFRLAEVLGILVTVGLFFALARRRTTPWIALAFSISLLFLGYAQETFLWPFDLHTVYSAAFGLAALMALERDDRRGDIGACVLLVLSVATLEVGLAFVVGAAIGVLQRDDRARRLWIFLVPIVFYGIWWLWAKKFGQSEVHLGNVKLVPSDFVNAFGAVAGSLTGLNPPDAAPEVTEIAPAGIFIAGLATVALFFRGRQVRLPATIWVSIGTLAVYWLTIALGDRAPDSSRYIFVGALLVLLVAADGLRDLRIGAWATVAVFAVIAFALPPNFAKMNHGHDQVRGMTAIDQGEYAMLELAGPKVPADYTASLEPAVQAAGGAVDAQLDAGEYREVLKNYGPLSSSVASIEKAAEPVPAVADATLVTALGLGLEPTAAPLGLGRCTEVSEASPTASAYFELEPGGAILGAPKGSEPVEIQLSRFARGGKGVPLGTLQPGEWAEVKIPRDSVKLPWDATVDGPVRICPLGGDRAAALPTPLAPPDHQELFAEHLPGEREAQVRLGQRRQRRQDAAEGVGEVLGDDPLGFEARRVEVLADRDVGERDVMVGAVPVVLRAVAVVGPHDRNPAARFHRVAHLFEEGGDRLLVVQVLEEVGDEDAVKVGGRQVGVLDFRDDPFGHRFVGCLGVGDLVDRPGLLGRDRLDELAAAGGRIEDGGRTTHQPVYVRRDLAPDRGPGTLVDVAEAVVVQALIVHRGGDLLCSGLRLAAAAHGTPGSARTVFC